jgi:hypothetical protein
MNSIDLVSEVIAKDLIMFPTEPYVICLGQISWNQCHMYSQQELRSLTVVIYSPLAGIS